MQLKIQLFCDDTESFNDPIVRARCLKQAAERIQMFNAGAAPLLVNGEIACNPDSFYDAPVMLTSIQEDGTEVMEQAIDEITGEPLTTRQPKEEGFLGTCNTVPNEFGYVTIEIPNYRKLKAYPAMMYLFADTFIPLWGEDVEDVELEDGSIIQVKGGVLQ